MPLFEYKAVNQEGESVEGQFEAENKAVLYEQLKKQTLRVVQAKEKKNKKFSVKRFEQFISRVSTQDKINLARNLSAMISAGLTVTRALSVIERQTTNPKFKSILAVVQMKISQGSTFHEALSQYPRDFSQLFVSMVKAGEESGNLAQSLGVISDQMKQSYELKRKIRGAMMYPAIVLIVMVLIGILMLVYIVPTLQKTFEEVGAELPIQTRMVIGASEMLQSNPLLIFGVLVLVVAASVYMLRTSWGRRGLEWTLLHLPVVGTLTKEVNAARTTRTLSSLLKSGVSMTESLDITRDVLQNSYYKEVIDEAGEQIEKGKNISEILGSHEKLYPVFVGEMASVGEETGKIDEMLFEVAAFYEDDISEKTKNLSTIVEPVLMVIIGVVVGFFAFSMLTPMYSLVDQI